MADETLSVRPGTLGGTEMRFHELALQHWLNRTFPVAAGYPGGTPVVFGSPMDAFGNFERLWKSGNNPFKYLFNLKDEKGRPLYEPYPSPVRYPIISVLRRNWVYKPERSYGLHQFRHMNWPTVSDHPDRSDLANVSVSFRPNGWDFHFQIDHFAMRPDTQAYFISSLFRAFRVGGGTPQTWIDIHYPALGRWRIRMYIDGNVDSSTKEEPEDQKHVEFRTTLNVVMEGYWIDQDIQILPAFWNLVIRKSTDPIEPDELNALLNSEEVIDMRVANDNPTLNARPNAPLMSPLSEQLISGEGTPAHHDIFLFGSEQPTAFYQFGECNSDPHSGRFLGGIKQTSGYGIITVGSL